MEHHFLNDCLEIDGCYRAQRLLIGHFKLPVGPLGLLS